MKKVKTSSPEKKAFPGWLLLVLAIVLPMVLIFFAVAFVVPIVQKAGERDSEVALTQAATQVPEESRDPLREEASATDILTRLEAAEDDNYALVIAAKPDLEGEVAEKLLKNWNQTGEWAYGIGLPGNSQNPGWRYCPEYPVLETLARNPDLNSSYLGRMVDFGLACGGYEILMLIAKNPATTEETLSKIEDKLKKHASEYGWNYSEYGSEFNQIVAER